MSNLSIPTGSLPVEFVTELPKKGKEYTIYTLIENPDDELSPTTDYRWHEGGWQKVDLGITVFGFLFNDYQKSVEQTIADLESRVESLEGGNILFEGSDISLKESMATIGKTIDITSTLTVSDGTECKVTLTGMTVDGNPIEDVEDYISLYGLKDWDWQGGDVYSDVFGNSAYFSFGTKPMNSIAKQVTLGFVNEQEHFDERTLVIGHIKVEVITSKGGKK